jgi:hypothetical protein
MATDPPAWAPSLSDVAHHLRRFTRDEHSRESLQFTAETAVTEVEATTAIGSAVEDVAATVGEVPESLHANARATAALGAAAEAVIDRDRDLSRDLYERFTERLDRLKHAVIDLGSGRIDAGRFTAPASGRFPAASPRDRTAF